MKTISLRHTASVPFSTNSVFCVFVKGLTEGEDNFFPKNSYEFSGYNINELVIMAKHSREAMDEYLKRIQFLIYKEASIFNKINRYLDFNDVYSTLFHTSLQAVKIYDRRKGNFMNLFRKMVKMSLRFFNSNHCKSYYRGLKNYGCRIRAVTDLNSFADCVQTPSSSDLTEDIKLQADFESYYSELTPLEQKIISMYINKFSIRDISIAVDESCSTVSYKIYLMLEDLKAWEKRKQI
ncbi:MAG: hypothetical protein WCS80_03485 [Bacilli bacterium]